MKLSEQFALNQWLTDYPDNLTYSEVIDLMLGDGDSEEWTHELITPWEVVEHFTLNQVVDFMEDTRAHFARVTNEK
jgi:CBS domain containing-hemolysin-like protein